jgi:hypothetical protein
MRQASSVLGGNLAEIPNYRYTFLFNLPAFGNVEFNNTVSYWHADAVIQADFWIVGGIKSLACFSCRSLA